MCWLTATEKIGMQESHRISYNAERALEVNPSTSETWYRPQVDGKNLRALMRFLRLTDFFGWRGCSIGDLHIPAGSIESSANCTTRRPWGAFVQNKAFCELMVLSIADNQKWRKARYSLFLLTVVSLWPWILEEKNNDTMPYKIIQPALFPLEMKSAVKYLVLPSEWATCERFKLMHDKTYN